nr:MAG: replication-associated protein [Circoviridae sp.]
MPYAQSINWCFTINHPTPADYEALLAYGPTARYLIFSDEVGDTGTPHIQGFVVLPKRARLRTVKQLFPRAHLEAAKGTAKQASDYCRGGADGKPPSSNIVVFGELPNVPGANNVYESFRDWVLQHPTKPTGPEIALQFPALFLRNSRTESFVDAIYPVVPVEPQPYRDYQQQLVDRLAQPPCSRKVIFVVDRHGNSGKSYFANTYYRSDPARSQILSVGRIEDVTYSIDITKLVFFFDVPRSRLEHFQYSVVEQLKDCRVFVTKYTSAMKFLVHPNVHVVVLCNEYPDITKLSADRYELVVWNYEQ